MKGGNFNVFKGNPYIVTYQWKGVRTRKIMTRRLSTTSLSKMPVHLLSNFDRSPFLARDVAETFHKRHHFSGKYTFATVFHRIGVAIKNN